MATIGLYLPKSRFELGLSTPAKFDRLNLIFQCTRMNKYILTGGILVSFLLPLGAYATAGWAERSWEWEYNNFTTISSHWGDYCRGCIDVENIKFTTIRDDGWYFPRLQKINVPQTRTDPHIFARTFVENYEGGDGDWFIFNVETQELVERSIKYDDLLPIWKALGYENPQFATYTTLNSNFEETENSKKMNSVFGFTQESGLVLFAFLLLLLPMLGFGSYIITLFLFAYLTSRFMRSYKTSKRRKDFILTVVFGVMTLIYIVAGITPFIMFAIFRALGNLYSF